MTKKKPTPNAETLVAMAEGTVPFAVPSEPWPEDFHLDLRSAAERRLAILAHVMETDLAHLESFVDLLGEKEMTDRRIADAQHVLGLCTPVLSHLRFPNGAGGPSCGKELLAEWLRRQAEVIALGPEDSAAFAKAILDPPPLAPAMERVMRRRAELLDKPKKRKK